MAESYSKYFSLNQLTQTDTRLTNKPDSSALEKIKHLGRVLDTMYEQIGPFKIISAYRAPAVQAALKAGGNTQAVSMSLHSTGQAADIMPINQNIKDYFAKITATPSVKNLLGGYAIKNTVVHIDTDTSKRVGVAMYVTKAGSYVRFSATELQNFIARNKVAAGGGLILLVGAGVAAYMMMRKKA